MLCSHLSVHVSGSFHVTATKENENTFCRVRNVHQKCWGFYATHKTTGFLKDFSSRYSILVACVLSFRHFNFFFVYGLVIVCLMSVSFQLCKRHMVCYILQQTPPYLPCLLCVMTIQQLNFSPIYYIILCNSVVSTFNTFIIQ